MSKIAKKLLSVVLAVLVLAAGFSTTLGAFRPVLADQVTVLDYTTLVDEVTSNTNTNDANGEKGLLKREVYHRDNNYYAVAPESFKLYDVMGFGTNFDNDLKGLRVFDYFFQKLDKNAYVVGGDVSDVHPYLIYEVEKGTAFSIDYKIYSKSGWAGLGLGDRYDDYGRLKILVSADGVNYIPANVSETAVAAGAWDKVTATVANVGKDTRYVKVMSLMDPSTVTNVWIPQDSIFVQKVIFTEASKAVDQTTINFKDSKVTKNGVSIGSDAAAARGVFYSSPASVEMNKNGLLTYGWSQIGNYVGDGWAAKQPIGALSEESRSYYLNVKPGTRFQLVWNNYRDHHGVAKAVVGGYNANKDGKEGYEAYAEYETAEDYAFKVYTSASMNGEWTEHRMAPASNSSKNGVCLAFNFIIPEGHLYVKIVNPLSGSVGGIMKLGEDGYPLASAKENAVSNSAGNDWFRLEEFTYTPFTLEQEDQVTYNYSDKTIYPYGTDYNKEGVEGLLYAPHEITKNGSDALTGTVGAYCMTLDNYRGNALGFVMNYVHLNGQRPYVIYKVRPGTIFSANVFVDYNTKVAAEAALNVPFEFIASSATAVDGTYTEIARTATNSGNQNTAFTFTVPEGTSYVKIEFPQTADVGGAVKNHQGVIKGVSFVPFETENPNKVFYDYKATGGSAVSSANGEDAFKTATHTYAAKNKVTFENNAAWGATVGGIYSDFQNIPVGGRAKSYVLYEVEAGSVFAARVVINAADRARYIAAGATDFEMIFYTAATADGAYTEIARTNTTATSGSVVHNVEFYVPANAKYVKVEFPQTGCVFGDRGDMGKDGDGNIDVSKNDFNGDGVVNTSDRLYGNHSVFLQNVSYVPLQKSEVEAVYYNYCGLSANYVSNEGKNPENTLKPDNATFSNVIGSVAAKYVVLDGWTANGKLGFYNDLAGMQNIDDGGAYRERAYIIYDAMPGTEFIASVGLDANHAAKHGEDASTFKFIVSASATIDGVYEEIGSAASTANIKVVVPEGKRYVKLEFPQRSATNDCKWPNHCGFFKDLTMTPYVEVEVEEEVEEKADTIDYAKGEVALGNANKATYGIYNFTNVKGTAKGVTAEEAATVTYKVGAKDLVISSNDNLKFAVSYDGVNFTEAQLFAYAGAYTVNVLEGKQYVKVYLDEGETITAAAVDALKPTATFINYNGAKVVEDVAEGTTPVAPAIAKRTGYDFIGWADLGAIYVDTTYIATYEKDADKTFTVALKAGSGSIVYPEGITETTVRFDDRITITAAAAPEGKVFDKWVDENGKVVSNSSKFSFLASGNLTLEAVYAETKSDFAPFIYNSAVATVNDNENGSWNMSVIWRVNAPANANITETGIFYAATNLGDGANWVDGAVKLAHSTTAANKTLMYTVTNISAAKDARYAIPYAVVGGEYVFGNVVSAVAEEIEEEEVEIAYGAVYNYKDAANDNYGNWNQGNLGAVTIPNNMLCKSSSRDGIEPESGSLAADWGNVKYSIVYKVTPGTKFEASFSLWNEADRAYYCGVLGVDSLEFTIESSATQDGTYANAVTTAGLGTSPVITYDVPAGCEYVKITFPQQGAVPGSITPENGWGIRLNDMALLTGVKLNGKVAYDYDVTYDYSTLASGGYGRWDQSLLDAIGAYNIPDSFVCKANDRTGLEPDSGTLANDWGSSTFTIVYKVEAGSKFEASFKLWSEASRANYYEKLGVDSLEFTIESSATADGAYANAVTTAGLGTDPVITYDVPADCEYVKITFPQKGAVPGTITPENSWGVRLNDMALLTGVKYNVQ